jgi:hypothetical protein
MSIQRERAKKSVSEKGIIDQWFNKISNEIQEQMRKQMEKTDTRNKPQSQAARRVTVQALKSMPQDQQGSFRENNGEPIPEEIIELYCTNSQTLSSPKKIKKNDGSIVDLPDTFKTTVMKSCLIGNKEGKKTEISIPLLVTYCQQRGLSLDAFMKDVYVSLGLTWVDVNARQNQDEVTAGSSASPVEDASAYISAAESSIDERTASFLKDTFGDGQDGRYVWNLTNRQALKNSLFPRGSKSFKLECRYLSLTKKERVAFQEASLTFELQTNGLCKVTGNMKDTNDVDGELKGFAVFLKPGETTNGNCWLFLRRIDAGFVSFLTLCFRLNENDAVRWKTRVATVLDLRATDSRPFLYRMLLCRDDKICHNMPSDSVPKKLCDANLSHFSGYVRLNTKSLLIDEDDFNRIIQATPENLKAAFGFEDLENIDTETLSGFQGIIQALSELNATDDRQPKKIHTICYSDRVKNGLMPMTVKQICENNPLLSSWLRRIELRPSNNQLKPVVDDDADKLFDEIIRRSTPLVQK